MDWKNKIKDEDCAEELEEMIIDYVKAGFWPDDKILMECEQYIEDFYREECADVTKEDLLGIIKALRGEYQNTGSRENFMKLDIAFRSLKKRGIVALHYAGYTQSDGFEDCSEMAEWMEQNGETVVGCCFYTEQDLGHILHEDTTLLYVSFGSYLDEPDAAAVGQMVADELKKAGLCVQWDGTEETKIAVEDFKWDKFYDGEADTD